MLPEYFELVMRNLGGKQLTYNVLDLKDFFWHIQRYLEAGFWYWDSEAGHIHFSRKVTVAIGVSDDGGVILEDFFSTVHHNDRKILRKAFHRLLTGKIISGDLEFRIYTKGTWRWYRTRAVVAAYNPDGSVSTIVGKFSNIDVSKFSVKPEITDKGEASFSFFRYRISDDTFQWFNRRPTVLEVKSTESNFPLIDELKPYIPVAKSSKLLQQWKFFIKGDEAQFSFPFTYSGPDKHNRKLRILASKTHDGIVEGVVVDSSSLMESDVSGRNEKHAILSGLNQLLVLSFNVTNGIIFCNRYTERVLGYKLAELTNGFSIKKLFSATPETYRQFTEFIRSDTQKPFECTVSTKDGGSRIITWSLVNVSGLDYSDDIILVGQDVTYTRNLQKEKDALSGMVKSYLNLNRRLLSVSIADNIYQQIGKELEQYFPQNTGLVFSFDDGDNFITIESIFGLSPKQWQRLVGDLGWNPLGRRFPLRAEIISKIQTSTPVKLDETLYSLTAGYISLSAAKIVERYMGATEIYLNGLLLDDNFYGGITVFSIDTLTDAKIQALIDVATLSSLAINQVQSRRSSAKELENLKQVNTYWSNLIAHVSHEIRTPLNAILGFSQLLVNSELNEFNRNQYIDIINSKGSSLIRLMNDIADFNNIEKGEFTIVRTIVNVNHLLQEIYLFYSNELKIFKRNSIDLKLSVPDNSDNIELLTDEGRLGQVIENLLNNALKFTERGTIEFGYTLADNQISVFVRDTGVGIDPKMQKMIFDKYRQVDAPQPHSGFGLGLKISRDIVSLLNGEIRVESQLDVGTTFYVLLPLELLTSESNSIDEESLLNGYGVDFKNRVILIVDDEEVNYMVLNEMLISWGATTLWAKNGREAVALVSSINQTIDLILMDIRMPVMDGYAATMEIKQINPKIPIIAQTAYASDEDRQKAGAAGCNGYITKPIEVSTLSSIIEMFLPN